MTESQEIKKALIRLRDFNCIVFNFNSNRPNNAGLAGHPDWLILTPKLNAVYLEVKIGKDSLSDAQKAVLNRLSSVMGLPHSRVIYSLCKSSKEAKQISDRIISREI